MEPAIALGSQSDHGLVPVVQNTMLRCIGTLIAAFITLAGDGKVAALDRSTPADNAWLIVVDDLHINFVDTGRVRAFLRLAVSELVRDGDVFELRTTGPSAATPLTKDLNLFLSGIKATTGNGLKPVDILGAGSSGATSAEVLFRANTALDRAYDALTAFARADGGRKAIIYISAGYDVDDSRLADRVSAFARRAREDGITIFAIDARSFETVSVPDSRVDATAWLRYATATRRSLTMMAEQAGGFVIEKANEPGNNLKRINLTMRPTAQACSFFFNAGNRSPSERSD
jgi:hypothetical protein